MLGGRNDDRLCASGGGLGGGRSVCLVVVGSVGEGPLIEVLPPWVVLLGWSACTSGAGGGSGGGRSEVGGGSGGGRWLITL